MIKLVDNDDVEVLGFKLSERRSAG